MTDAGDKRARMERLVRSYFAACNSADVDAVAACFTPDAVHYFPPGMYGGPFRGARTIGERWHAAVQNLGSYWTIDRFLCDPDADQAVIEWTHFKTRENSLLRGDEWYEFDGGTGLIREIRAYYASPQDSAIDRLELDGFDYEGQGYPHAPPAGAR